MPKPEPKRPDVAHDQEPDPRERLLQSDLSFEQLTRKILQKMPPPGGWTDQRGEREDEPER